VTLVADKTANSMCPDRGFHDPGPYHSSWLKTKSFTGFPSDNQ
jgi:hypothetical protein